MSRKFTLVGSTTSQLENWGIAVLQLTPQQAAELWFKRSVWGRAKGACSDLFSLEIFDARVTYADEVKLDIHSHHYGEWNLVVYPSGGRFAGDIGRICEVCTYATVADVAIVMQDGVGWSASPKHSDGHFETPVLSWVVLERMAAGETPTLNELPRVVFDPKENG